MYNLNSDTSGVPGGIELITSDQFTISNGILSVGNVSVSLSDLKVLDVEEEFHQTVIDGTNHWVFPEYSLRIVSPMQIVLSEIGIKMYGWFSLNMFPMVNTGDGMIHLYCNVILEEHQDIIDELGGIITIENRP